MSLSKNDIKFIRSLHLKKFRDQEGLFIVEGVKLLNELLAQDTFEIQDLYCLESVELNQINGASIHIISNKELERISALKSPNQALAVVKQNNSKKIDFKGEGAHLILDSINDPGNFGTIIRTADWFGVKQIICSPNSVDLYNPKVIQSTMGAIFRVEIIYADIIPVLSEFKENDFELLSAEMEGESIFEKDFQAKTVFVMGSESHGVDDSISKACDKITIPAFGKTESLNVGMATGIILSHYAKNCQ